MRAFHFGLLAIGAALHASTASAQTLFAWPDTTVDIAAYTRLEECQAAVTRSMDYTRARESLASGEWTDTIPVDSLDPRGPEPLPAPVVETARRCAARFADADSVSLERFEVLLSLYFQAGWDDKARVLVERRLAAIGPKDDTQRAAVIDSLLDVFRSSGWAGIGSRRSEMARDVVERHLPKVADRVKRIRIYARMSVFMSAEHGDSAKARLMTIMSPMAGILDSLTEKEMDALLSAYGPLAEGLDEPADFVQRYFAMLNMTMGKRTFLDSLRSSTAAYVKLKRGNWSEATGWRPETYGLGNPLGERAKPIVADIWLGHDPSRGRRPAPGRVSLVVFLNAHECPGNCARSLHPLAQLEHQFPELEITVVAQSYGYFMYLKDSITPEREAELTKQWLETNEVHAPLAMTSTNSWRLPDPDGRRLSRPTDNRTNYTFGKSWNVDNSDAFLIDQDGIVIHSRQMNRWAVFEDYNELIGILLERRMAGLTP